MGIQVWNILDQLSSYTCFRFLRISKTKFLGQIFPESVEKCLSSLVQVCIFSGWENVNEIKSSYNTGISQAPLHFLQLLSCRIFAPPPPRLNVGIQVWNILDQLSSYKCFRFLRISKTKFLGKIVPSCPYLKVGSFLRHPVEKFLSSLLQVCVLGLNGLLKLPLSGFIWIMQNGPNSKSLLLNEFRFRFEILGCSIFFWKV